MRELFARMALSLRPLLRALLPEGLRSRYRDRVYRAANWAEMRAAAPAPPEPGVSLYGMLTAPTGMGSAARLLAGGCLRAEIPLSLHPLHAPGSGSVPLPETLRPYVDGPARETNLFVCNADSVEYFLHQTGAGVLAGRYNIAHWSWELPEFPARWDGSFAYFHEIWTISEFCREAIARRTDKPVSVIPYGIRVYPEPGLGRADFDLPEGRLLFLCMADVKSVAARKNPRGALEAYCRAFPGRDEGAGLVVKLGGGAAAAPELAALRALAAGREDVFFLTEDMHAPRLHGLMALCDSFISLHRSEGFGLPIAEAMLLGKAAVVTGWSGNMDFTNEGNACCVPYTLRPLGRDAAPPYDAEQYWAEPDLDAAAECLRTLAGDAALRRRLGEAAGRTVRERYSPEACGAGMARRLRAAGRLG